MQGGWSERGKPSLSGVTKEPGEAPPFRLLIWSSLTWWSGQWFIAAHLWVQHSTNYLHCITQLLKSTRVRILPEASKVWIDHPGRSRTLAHLLHLPLIVSRIYRIPPGPMGGSGTQSLRRAGPASMEYTVLKAGVASQSAQWACGVPRETWRKRAPPRLGVGHRKASLLFPSFFFKMQFSVSGLSCNIYELSCHMWDLVPWPGIKLRVSALEVQSLSHWTTREIHPFFSF